MSDEPEDDRSAMDRAFDAVRDQCADPVFLANQVEFLRRALAGLPKGHWVWDPE